MRKNGLSYYLIMAAAVFLMSLASAEPSPAGGVMIGLNAARAIKKHKEKNEQAQALEDKMNKLRERYPQEVQEFQSLEKVDPEAAGKKLKTMLRRYEDDTGVDLDQLYDVKSSAGPARRLLHRFRGESSAVSDQ